jgi:hypothetical protein
VSRLQINVLTICLTLTGAFISLRPKDQVPESKRSLAQALSRKGQWSKVSRSSLSPDIVEALHLDDYIFQRYAFGQQEVDLYVGYYYSSDKVEVAHDPLVCFPVQGWQVSDNRKSTFKFYNEGKNNAFVRFSTTLNNESELYGQKRILAFIKDFHPVFIKSVEGA